VARIRTIKPEFFRHEGLQDLEAKNPGHFVMLTFVGLWTVCDRAGRFEYRPRQLKLDILPFLDFSMEQTLEILGNGRFLARYEVDSRPYGLIPTFEKHQRFTGKEALDPPRYPAPPEGSIGDFPGVSLGSERESTEIPGKGKGKGKGNEFPPHPPKGGVKQKHERAPVERGTYPQELHEAINVWGGLLKNLHGLEDQYPSDKRFLPSHIGSKEKTWKAWEKHLATTVQGHPVTSADILAGVKLWADAKHRRAKQGLSLAAPMLPTMLNDDDFIDGLVKAVEQRIEAEESRAMEPPPVPPRTPKEVPEPVTPGRAAEAISKDREGPLPSWIKTTAREEAS
jgi:hypothetical protein